MVVTEIVFRKKYDGIMQYINMADIPKQFLTQEYHIDIEKNNAFYASDHGSDEHTILRVIKLREETKEEIEKRKKELEEAKVKSKKKRYEDYLKLKKEFEV